MFLKSSSFNCNFFIYFFALTQKSNKKSQGNHQRSAGFAGPTHKDSDGLKVVSRIEVEGRRFFVVLCGATGGAAFSLRMFIVIRGLQ